MLTKLLLSLIIATSVFFIREVPSEQAANGLPAGKALLRAFASHFFFVYSYRRYSKVLK